MRRVCCVCEQDNPDYCFRPSRSPGPIVQCKTCGFVYVNPIETTKSLIQEGPVLNGRAPRLLESSNLDDIEGSWEQPLIERYISELPAKQLNAQEALTHINNLAKIRGTLLDVGCFCGVFLNVASQEGWDCYGLEPLVMPAIYARGRFGVRVTTDTLRDDTYPSELFDVVTAFQVFEHLVDPAQELVRIQRLLKPNGLLVIEVPNIDTAIFKLLRAKHRHFVEDHVSFFSAKTLTYLLERMGFQVREVYYPVRVVSFRHLVWWIERYTSSALGGYLGRVLSSLHFDTKTVGVRIGDIITVIAQKTTDVALR
jgi:2-polyprenyl-3-methyl-5-hydroxy-6-metoxy-1,4-benzoquinol methylase